MTTEFHEYTVKRVALHVDVGRRVRRRPPRAPRQELLLGAQHQVDLRARRVALHVDDVATGDDRGDRDENLLAMCQRCHLVMDRADNLSRRREREAAARGQLPFPALAVMPEHRGGRS